MEWIATQNHNYLLMGLITFSSPVKFLTSIYNRNRGLRRWNNKKACITISFDCDYPEDVEAIPSVLKLLSEHAFKASFACVGHWIEKFPKEHAMILDRGHEIVNHTYSHPDNEMLNPGRKFKNISRSEKLDEIERCHEVCVDVLGYEPKGCRIPHFKNLFTAEIYGILKDLNYHYSSSTWLTNTASYGMPFIADEGIVEFPLSTCPSHPFTVFDTWHSLNADRLSHKIKHRGEKSYYDLFNLLLNIGLETGSYINVYLDPLDIKTLSQFGGVLETIAGRDVWVATYEDILYEDKYINKKDINYDDEKN